jgi:hypothetical protein
VCQLVGQQLKVAAQVEYKAIVARQRHKAQLVAVGGIDKKQHHRFVGQVVGLSPCFNHRVHVGGVAAGLAQAGGGKAVGRYVIDLQVGFNGHVPAHHGGGIHLVEQGFDGRCVSGRYGPVNGYNVHIAHNGFVAHQAKGGGFGEGVVSMSKNVGGGWKPQVLGRRSRRRSPSWGDTAVSREIRLQYL